MDSRPLDWNFSTLLLRQQMPYHFEKVFTQVYRREARWVRRESRLSKRREAKAWSDESERILLWSR